MIKKIDSHIDRLTKQQAKQILKSLFRSMSISEALENYETYFWLEEVLK